MVGRADQRTISFSSLEPDFKMLLLSNRAHYSLSAKKAGPVIDCFGRRNPRCKSSVGISPGVGVGLVRLRGPLLEHTWDKNAEDGPRGDAHLYISETRGESMGRNLRNRRTVTLGNVRGIPHWPA